MTTTTATITTEEPSFNFKTSSNEFYRQLETAIPIGFVIFFIYCIVRKTCIDKFEIRRKKSKYFELPIKDLNSIDMENPDSSSDHYPKFQVPPLSSTAFVTWVWDIWQMDSNTFYLYAGLDATIFRLFLKSAVGICLFSMPYALFVLTPIYATSPDMASDGDNFDYMTMNAIGPKSDRLYAVVVGAYLISCVSCYFLSSAYLKIAYLSSKYLIESSDMHDLDALTWFNYNDPDNQDFTEFNLSFQHGHKVKKQSQLQDIEEEDELKQSLSMELDDRSDSDGERSKFPPIDRYTVLMQNLPKYLCNERKLLSFMNQTFPEQIVHVVVVPDVRELTALQEEIKYHQEQLYKICEEEEYDIKNLYDAVKLRLKFDVDTANIIIRHRDQKDEYIAKFNQLQESELELTTTAFVVFNSLTAVSSFLSTPNGLDLINVSISRAPDWKIIDWDNLNFEPHHMFCRNLGVSALLTGLLLFWSIPIIAIQGLANIESLFELFGGDANDFFGKSTIAWLQGSLSVLILDGWLKTLPGLMSLLSKAQKPADLATYRLLILKKYFFCLIFMVLLVTVVSNMMLSDADTGDDYFKNVANNLGDIADLMGNGLSDMAVYFLIYILLHAFVWLPVQLFRPFDYVKKKLNINQPNRYSYATRVPQTLLIFTIVMTYSVMNPIMWIFGLIYFVFGTIVFTYNSVMAYVPIYDIGPKLWMLIFNLVQWVFYISTITLYGLMMFKQKFVCAVLLIPMLAFVIMYTNRVKRKFSGMLKSASMVSAKLKDRQLRGIDGYETLRMDEKELDRLYLPPVLQVKYKKRGQYYQLQD